MILLVQRTLRLIERGAGFVRAAVRFAVGWHLAYLGVWALTSTYDYSWVGCFRCARWLFGGTLRAIGDSCAMGAIDVCLAWGLLIAGVLLMVGRLVRPAAVFGVIYFALMYVLNPPHFGHTGESHFMYIDRNVIEIVMLFCVMRVESRLRRCCVLSVELSPPPSTLNSPPSTLNHENGNQ